MIAFGDTITVTRRIQDANGDATDGASHDIEGCAVWPAATTEAVNSADLITWEQVALLPAGSDVLATDAVTYRGARYSVVGQPQSWRSPLTGTTSGIEIHLTTSVG